MLSISGKLEAENSFSYKTVWDLNLHLTDVISYANHRGGIPKSV